MFKQTSPKTVIWSVHVPVLFRVGVAKCKPVWYKARRYLTVTIRCHSQLYCEHNAGIKGIYDWCLSQCALASTSNAPIWHTKKNMTKAACYSHLLDMHLPLLERLRSHLQAQNNHAAQIKRNWITAGSQSESKVMGFKCCVSVSGIARGSA